MRSDFFPPVSIFQRLPRLGLGFSLFVFSLVSCNDAFGRSFRVSQLPNGSVFGCANCHVTQGGPRNNFGKAVQAITGSSTKAFWDAVLAGQDSDGDGFTNGEELGDPDGDGKPAAGAKVTNPGDPASKPAVVVTPISIGIPILQADGHTAQLEWDGGNGVYLIQRKNRVADTNWVNVLTTTNSRALVGLSGTVGLFRVQNDAKTVVIPLTVTMTGEAEVPAVDTSGHGFGTLSLEGNTLTYQVDFTGLKSPASAAHIHGPAGLAENAAVLYPLNGAAGTAGELSGVLTLSDTNKDLILQGRAYINIHTISHPAGEIRGQIQVSP
ncbi:MAG TPA: CHRD domain-containing protein [Candidatus Paceibacterota bacterium]|nr:CHRD domain-containing protein [Verrucomicrobiota bacterium]HRY50117.1 CHRD domain-containing protein [Candidatus Paceibacterota bacterium]HSA02599.1 CHRD domain-containing protein [Candidatus Paceibacterota bacterium]